MRRLVRGYWRTWRQYLSTPKGAHDSRDYARAMLFIILTIAVIYLMLYAGGGIG